MIFPRTHFVFVAGGDAFALVLSRGNRTSKEFLSFRSAVANPSFDWQFQPIEGRNSLRKGPSVPARTILLVEDEIEMATGITAALEESGYLVRTVSMTDATETARVNGAAILILDRLLSGADSLHALQALRSRSIKIPVLLISALSSAHDVVQGLKAGADDYLVKPFLMVELVARVEALLRRLGEVRTTKFSVGDLEMDLIERTVTLGGIEIELLPREFKLLEYFLRHPGQVVTRAMLLNDVWRQDSAIPTNVVDMHIANLRKKIDTPGRPTRIANVRGMGFVLRTRS